MQAKKLMMGAAFCCAAILGTAQEFKNDGLQGNPLNASFFLSAPGSKALMS